MEITRKYTTSKVLHAIMKNIGTCLQNTRSHKDCWNFLAKCLLSSLTYLCTVDLASTPHIQEISWIQMMMFIVRYFFMIFHHVKIWGLMKNSIVKRPWREMHHPFNSWSNITLCENIGGKEQSGNSIPSPHCSAKHTNQFFFSPQQTQDHCDNWSLAKPYSSTYISKSNYRQSKCKRRTTDMKSNNKMNYTTIAHSKKS
jgi:hypothetical protein